MPQRPMPQRLGRYVVRRRIGNGAFATVWLAYDEQLDSPVAVKVLADNWTEDQHIRKRFQEEGRYLRKVESPHVVSVYDAGELDDGRPYLVMSYADQGTLADRLEVEGLTVAQAMEVIRQVGAGLQALHDRDIVHRDVKPANVLFRSVSNSSTGEATVRAMVGDLGLGRALDMSSRLTMVAGTPSYVAPEQARAEAPDARADQYSLAALAYLLLAGRPAYQHASLIEAGQPGPLPQLSTQERPFPRGVDAALRRGLAHDREERYPTVTGFVTALEAALGPDLEGSEVTEALLPVDPDLTQPGPRPSVGPESGDRPVSGQARGPRRRRARVLGGVLVGLLCLAAGAAVGYAVERNETPDDRTVDDAEGTLSVTVPADWDRADATEGWRPPNTEADFPALAAGTTLDWATDDSTGNGVFVGLMPGEEIPAQIPQHPECGQAGSPVRDTSGDVSTTVVYTDCPGGTTVERVVQVTSDTVLWIQVRSPDRATANRVLDSVETHGLG